MTYADAPTTPSHDRYGGQPVEYADAPNRGPSHRGPDSYREGSSPQIIRVASAASHREPPQIIRAVSRTGPEIPREPSPMQIVRVSSRGPGDGRVEDPQIVRIKSSGRVSPSIIRVGSPAGSRGPPISHIHIHQEPSIAPSDQAREAARPQRVTFEEPRDGRSHDGYYPTEPEDTDRIRPGESELTQVPVQYAPSTAPSHESDASAGDYIAPPTPRTHLDQQIRQSGYDEPLVPTIVPTIRSHPATESAYSMNPSLRPSPRDEMPVSVLGPSTPRHPDQELHDGAASPSLPSSIDASELPEPHIVPSEGSPRRVSILPDSQASVAPNEQEIEYPPVVVDVASRTPSALTGGQGPEDGPEDHDFTPIVDRHHEALNQAHREAIDRARENLEEELARHIESAREHQEVLDKERQDLFDQAEAARQAAAAAAEERRIAAATEFDEAERRRQAEFDEHEAERQRLFEEAENQRHATLEARRQTLMEEADAKRAALSEAAEADRISADQLARESIAASVFVVESVASAAKSEHDSVKALSGLLAEARSDKALSDAESKRMSDAMLGERDQIVNEQQERIRNLEEELARCREDCAAEKAARVDAEEAYRAQQRAEAEAHHNELRAHLGDVTNQLRDRADDEARRREMEEEIAAAKEIRRAEKAERDMSLHDLVNSIITEREEEKRRQEAERAAAALRPGSFFV